MDVLSFTLRGTAELQEVEGHVSFDGARATVTLAIRHVEYNAADGTDEAVRQWTEVWEATVDAGERLRVTAITRDGVAGRSLLLQPLTAAVGSVVVLQRATRDLRVEPEPPAPRDPRDVAEENRRAGWRMSWQKSGEDPDAHPPPDDPLDPTR